MNNDIFGKVMATSYGLEFIICSPQQWSEIKNDMSDPYDVSVGDMHIKNYGFVILDAEYKQPIDNEYDLEEIVNQINSSVNSTLAENDSKNGKVRLTESQLRTVIRKTISNMLKENYAAAAEDLIISTAEEIFGDDEDSKAAAFTVLQDVSPEEILNMPKEELINLIHVAAM